MKKISILLFALLFLSSLFINSCADSDNTESKTQKEGEPNLAEIILNKIEENGDLINSPDVPTMIEAEELQQMLEKSILMLDTRKVEDFQQAHIAGAVNLKASEILDYFDNNQTQQFELVVLVCYAGQTASYLNAILQMLGYDNVYTLKWGMAAWNETSAAKWLDNYSDAYADIVVKENFPQNPKTQLPKNEADSLPEDELLRAMSAKLINDGFKAASLTIDELMENPDKYYIVNYVNEDTYNAGHLPGAVRYQPKSSLKLSGDLLTLPTDKPIVVYCYTGQHSAFVTAYLRLLGYDAYSLKFGQNGFMNTLLSENEKASRVFSPEKILNFEIETSN